MRILVLSDSHKNPYITERIIRAENTAKHIFFLGDVTEDIEAAAAENTDRIYHIVAGNCDGFSDYPQSDIVTVGGVPVYFTHGHTFDVAYGTERLQQTARGAGAKILLYGHTHIKRSDYKDGLYIVNPGSVSRPRDNYPSYAAIDITENGILVHLLDAR